MVHFVGNPTTKANMDLTTWKNSPKGRIRKPDVSIAKNYLSEEEFTALNRIVTMYLDYAEDQAQGRKPMHMADWVQKLDGFLRFNEKEHSRQRRKNFSSNGSRSRRAGV